MVFRVTLWVVCREWDHQRFWSQGPHRLRFETWEQVHDFQRVHPASLGSQSEGWFWGCPGHTETVLLSMTWVHGKYLEQAMQSSLRPFGTDTFCSFGKPSQSWAVTAAVIHNQHAIMSPDSLLLLLAFYAHWDTHWAARFILVAKVSSEAAANYQTDDWKMRPSSNMFFFPQTTTLIIKHHQTSSNIIKHY